MEQSPKNVYGEDLKICGCDPMTGWFRDGYCKTDHHDTGIHTVCCVVTADFLKFSMEQGNDLITPNPRFHFKGLNPGEHWCLCASRWLEAYKAGRACPVILESTHEETLAMIPLAALKQHVFLE